MHRYVILHNVRSAYNVGAIFRTADGAGVSKIFLTGYTPTPTDRFGRPQPEIGKTSLGACESVPWEYFKETEQCVDVLKREQITLVAVEQHARTHDYREVSISTDAAFLFGNEIEGVPASLCEAADVVIGIPMLGKKESLNVSVTAGIILFHFA